jgi:hypothetical protein
MDFILSIRKPPFINSYQQVYQLINHSAVILSTQVDKVVYNSRMIFTRSRYRHTQAMRQKITLAVSKKQHKPIQGIYNKCGHDYRREIC